MAVLRQSGRENVKLGGNVLQFRQDGEEKTPKKLTCTRARSRKGRRDNNYGVGHSMC